MFAARHLRREMIHALAESDQCQCFFRRHRVLSNLVDESDVFTGSQSGIDFNSRVIGSNNYDYAFWGGSAKFKKSLA